MSVIAALPFMLLMTLMCASLYIDMDREHTVGQKRKKARDKLLEKLLEERSNKS